MPNRELRMEVGGGFENRILGVLPPPLIVFSPATDLKTRWL